MFSAKTTRKDGIIISTVKPPFMAWYGKYETAIIFKGDQIRIAEGYDTLQEAKCGHEKYSNMPYEEIIGFDFID